MATKQTPNSLTAPDGSMYITLTDGAGNLVTTGGSGITVGTTTITSGTSGRILYDNSGVVGEFSQSSVGQVRLDYVSATAIKATPFNGDKIQIAGAVYQIPSGGISAANTSVYVNGAASQNLAASTVYNVYLFNNAGTLTVDFSTTARATDTTAGNVGVQIKTGDNTRTLIGKVETNSSSQFYTNGVISWFNRRALTVTTSDGNDRTASAIWTEVFSGLQCRFLTWGTSEGAMHVNYKGCLKHATLAASMYVGIGVDGISSVIASQSASEYVANNFVALSGSESFNSVEGVHYVTLVGAASTGSTTFTGTNTPSSVTLQYWG